jgi:hypothetical protein
VSTPSIAITEPDRRLWLTGALVCLHASIVLYVAIGWLGHTRLGLLVYLVVLPLIMLQWLFNRGDSIFRNAAALLRTGLWRDTRNRRDGSHSQALLLVMSAAMLPLWIAAFYHMILIPTHL